MNNNKLSVKTFEMNGFKKCFLIIDLEDVFSFESVRDMYSMLFKYIEDNKIKIIYEKVFGQLEYKEQYKRLRTEFVKAPLSYIDGKSVTGSPIASILICGIKDESADVMIRTIKGARKEDIIGTEICSPSFQYLYLAEIKAKRSDFNSMYKELEDCLETCGYCPNDIIRTWIYIDHIDENYNSFNSARREFFERNDIKYDKEAKRLPASTCISGITEADCSGMMDVQCLKNMDDSCVVERVYNVLQNEAEGNEYLYKPTFSRGMLINVDNHREVHISGTASINEIGKTVFVNDPYGQIKKTLVNVNSILGQFDMTLSDLCQSTCFFKKKEYYVDFVRCLEDLGMSKFSNTFVVADVCRSDLLFELDGIAIKENTFRKGE